MTHIALSQRVTLIDCCEGVLRTGEVHSGSSAESNPMSSGVPKWLLLALEQAAGTWPTPIVDSMDDRCAEFRNDCRRSSGRDQS